MFGLVEDGHLRCSNPYSPEVTMEVALTLSL